MQKHQDLRIPESLMRRLAAEATERDTSPEELLPELLEAALDLDEMDFWEGRGGGEHLRSLLFGAPTLGFAYPAERDDNGEMDHDAQQRDVAEVRELTRGGELALEPEARDFEVGRGAQGDPWTWLQLAQTISAVFGAVAAPAVAWAAWAKVAERLRPWLRARRARAGLGFVKACCLEDARGRVEDPDELRMELVAAHGGQALFAELAEEVAVGPYCVTVQVPERSATFVYVTDELGEILHFHEVKSDEVGGIVPDDYG